MGQINAKLRSVENGIGWWCPACEEMHRVSILGPRPWGFNGNYDAPTFTPSVKVTGKHGINKNGQWTGEYYRGPDGKALDLICHVFITDGRIQFLGDCTNKKYAGRLLPIPDLPVFMRDGVLNIGE